MSYFIYFLRPEVWHTHWAIQLLEERLAMKKWSRKHGGFRPLLTPHGTFGYRYLPLTNRDAMLLTKSSPWFLQKKIVAFLFSGQTFKKKILFFRLLTQELVKIMRKCFFWQVRVVKLVRFLSFYPAKCTFPFPKVIEMVNSFW